MRSHVCRIASLVSCFLVMGCAEETFISPDAPEGLTQHALLDASDAYTQGNGVTDAQTLALLNWYDLWMASPDLSSTTRAVRQAFEEEVTVRGIGWEGFDLTTLDIVDHSGWGQFEEETAQLFYSMPRGASPSPSSGTGTSTGSAAFIAAASASLLSTIRTRVALITCKNFFSSVLSLKGAGQPDGGETTSYGASGTDCEARREADDIALTQRRHPILCRSLAHV